MAKKGESPGKQEIDFFSSTGRAIGTTPVYSSSVPAGFPSPAEDYSEKSLDLNEYLIRNRESTFMVRVTGHSMKDAGIHDGDILVVDRSLEPRSGRIILGVLNGEFTVKRLSRKGRSLFLLPENDEYPVTEIKEEMDFRVWGVVTYVIHKV